MADSSAKPDDNSLWSRLQALGVINKVIRRGVRRSGVPESLVEDAEQEARIELLATAAGDDYSDGACVNCALAIAQRAGLRVRREMAMAASIPKDVFGRHEGYMHAVPLDLESVAYAIWEQENERQKDQAEWAKEPSMTDRFRITVERRLDTLPNSQRELVGALIGGDSLPSAAERIGVSESSARRYIQRALSELGWST